MAIKKPSITKPGIVKPSTGIKKPGGLAKPAVEEPVKEVVVQEVEEEIIEEVEIPEDVIIKPETIEEVSNVEEVIAEVPAEEPVQEEVEEEIKVEEEVVVEEEESKAVEEPAPKKKSSKKKSSNKKAKTEVVEEEQPVAKGPYKAKPLADAMNDMVTITECTTPEWEERKAAIKEQVEGMHIDPDSTPAEMRYLIADIDAALSQLKIYKINADQQFNPLLKHINYVSLQAGSKGSNSEERKANAIRGLIEYKSNPDDMEYTNLLDIQVYAENQINFYDEMIKILVDKKNMLITFSGIVKTETQLGSY